MVTKVEDSVSSRTDPGSRYIAPLYPIYKKKASDGTVREITPKVSFESFRDSFPDIITGVAGRGTHLETKVEGIPVRPTKEEIELEYSYDYYYRPVPAGCVFGTGEGDATLGVRADDYNNNQHVILTAAHIFKAPVYGWSEEVHQPYWNYDDDQFKIGVTDSDRRVNKNNFDAVVVQELTANTTRKFAANSEDTLQDDYPVRGIISNSEIDDNAGNQNFELTKQGVVTGRTSGFISGWDGSIVSYRASSKPGDSGSPIFHEYENQAQDYTYSLIAGIHKGRSGGSATGTSIENIEERFNVNVGL